MSKFLIIGGGGKVALKFASAASKAGHKVTSVVRNDNHVHDITAAGATPHILSLEASTVADLTSLFQSVQPNAIIFSAGAGGKGGPERTKAVDYEGALKVFDAMEAGNFHRILMVSATDLRDRSKEPPSYYNDESKKMSDTMWKAIPAYMEAKLAADRDLHARKSLKATIIRPGGLTDDPAGGCQLGTPQLGRVSRETVANVLLACALDPATEGKTWDLMDGDDDVESAIKKALESGVDSWHE